MVGGKRGDVARDGCRLPRGCGAAAWLVVWWGGRMQPLMVGKYKWARPSGEKNQTNIVHNYKAV